MRLRAPPAPPRPARQPGPVTMVGIGYDSHRFAPGRRLILGGVEIPHEEGLDGHSDADVLTHAVIDAILGAAGGGDIGTLFPPEEERWKDADSIDLLRTAVGTVPGAIVNVDATIVCERPRLGPHREEMERTLGEATSARVSVKATSNEGMGWIGRGEGIACIAVATVRSE
jgi:2-C-methyl-D-erythritol 2,4-cyclodiphosphate synthase